MGLKNFSFGLLVGALLVGCASFSYKYYGLDGVSYENGKLLGPEPKYDRLFSECAPTTTDKSPCVVLFATEFKAFKTDYEDTKNKLKTCEAQVNALQ